MDTRKLVDAINDLCEQRDVLTEAIDSMRKALITLQGPNGTMAAALKTIEVKAQTSNSNGHRSGSHLDHVLKVLAAADAPMHIVKVTEEVSKLANKDVTRASIDGAVSRHIRDSKRPQIARIGAGEYALTSWVAQHSAKISPPTKQKGLTRKDALTDYIRANGPTSRGDLVERTGTPAGSVGGCLNDKERFKRLDDGRWDVVTA
jgi:hypothetical protein